MWADGGGFWGVGDVGVMTFGSVYETEQPDDKIRYTMLHNKRYIDGFFIKANRISLKTLLSSHLWQPSS